MVKIYYHDNVDSDQRLPHEGEPAPLSALQELGIYVANIPDRAEVDRIAKEKGYENRDEVPNPNFGINGSFLCLHKIWETNTQL